MNDPSKQYMCFFTSFTPVKDRVGRSGRDPHRAYLTNDISLNINNRKTHNISKNSQLPYLSGDIKYHYVPQG